MHQKCPLHPLFGVSFIGGSTVQSLPRCMHVTVYFIACTMYMYVIMVLHVLLVFQTSYDAIKKVIKATSEDPVLGKYIGYTEDQVHTYCMCPSLYICFYL